MLVIFYQIKLMEKYFKETVLNSKSEIKSSTQTSVEAIYTKNQLLSDHEGSDNYRD